MNQTEAIVVRLEGRYAWVQASGPGSACGSCAQSGSCGASTLEADRTELHQRKPLLLRLPNTIGAQPGDEVIIRAADGVVLRAAWLAYGMPLLLALAAALAATAWIGSEIVTFIAMLLGLGAGVFLLRKYGLESQQREPILSLDFKSPSPTTIFFKDRE